MIAKAPKYPAYDPARDGNPLQWIVAAAARLRRQQDRERWNRVRHDYLTGKPALRQPKR